MLFGLILGLFKYCKDHGKGKESVNILNLMKLRRVLFSKGTMAQNSQLWKYLSDDELIAASISGTVYAPKDTMNSILSVFDQHMRTFTIQPTLMEMLSIDAVIVAPAYIEEGRSTIGSYQLLNGTPIERTQCALDPKAPIYESYIPNIIAKDLNDKFKNYKKVNHVSGNTHNNLVKNYPSNICIDNNNNYKFKSNRNNRKINSEKPLDNITYSINRTNSCANNDQGVNNSKFLLNSYKIEKLQDIPETISIPLNEEILNKDTNELTILVQNLGFDKGFSGDTNNPRGLVFFETIPQTDIEFYTCEKLAPERNSVKESENPYLTKLTASFDIETNENEYFAKYISFENFNCRRATIFLNGTKIGRYIKRTYVQDKFYLINEFLKPHNTLEIVVWEKDRNIKSAWGFKSDIRNVKILIGTWKAYKIYKQ